MRVVAVLDPLLNPGLQLHRQIVNIRKNDILQGSMAPLDFSLCRGVKESSVLTRRERVIRIFPNEASAPRLIGTLSAEKHETWSTGKKYFDMPEYLEAQSEAGSREIEAKI